MTTKERLEEIDQALQRAKALRALSAITVAKTKALTNRINETLAFPYLIEEKAKPNASG